MSQSDQPARPKKINIGHNCDIEIDVASNCSNEITVIGHQGNIIVTVPDDYQGSATIIGHRGHIVVRISSAATSELAQEQKTVASESVHDDEDKLVNRFNGID